jgi:hypothetical protein
MLDNRGSTPIQDVSLRVSLIDDQGTTLEQTKVPLAVPVLAGHGEVPFSAEFKARAGTRVEVEIVSYGIAQSPPLPLQIEVVRRTKTGDGQLAVMGRLTNPGADPIRVVGLVLSATDADNVLAGLSSNWFGLTGLAPKQGAPFLALLPAGSDPVHLTGYAAAEAFASPAASPIEISAGPTLRMDDQGNPIVLAVLHNRAQGPALARLLVSLTGDGGPASAGVYDSPIPLEPGEMRPVALTDFPGLVPQLVSGAQHLDTLRAQGLIDMAGSLAEPETVVTIKVEITAYESVGGSLLVHGTAHNQSGEPVFQPTAIGALRSTSGEVWSAGEASLGGPLPSGSQKEFLIVMPRPSGVEPSQGEFDFRGLGLAR